MSNKTPDQVLINQIVGQLCEGPANILDLCLATARHPENVRRAVEVLLSCGSVQEHSDCRRYQLADRPLNSGLAA